MPTPPPVEAPGDPTPLCVRQIAALAPPTPGRPAWLVEQLWGHQAVGLLGGPPKACKTFLALELALAVASGSPCLGRFAVPDPGPVLLFAAEDNPLEIRTRLAGLAQARGVDFERLPVFLILAEQLRLDESTDQRRLAAALQTYRPRLLLLDPLVRLHRRDENVAHEVAPLLADLRTWQRRWEVAVLLVHHTRKVQGPLTGQDLRGSTELFAWGDSYLYLRPAQQQLCLTAEHRAAPAPQPLTLTLRGDPPRLQIEASLEATAAGDLAQQVLETLSRQGAPLSQEQLRAVLQVRNQTLTAALHQLRAEHRIRRSAHGWMRLG